MTRVTPSGKAICDHLPARRGLVRLGRFIGAGTLCGHPSDQLQEP
jgi:hypothetical protein